MRHKKIGAVHLTATQRSLLRALSMVTGVPMTRFLRDAVELALERERGGGLCRGAAEGPDGGEACEVMTIYLTPEQHEAVREWSARTRAPWSCLVRGGLEVILTQAAAGDVMLLITPRDVRLALRRQS